MAAELSKLYLCMIMVILSLALIVHSTSETSLRLPLSNTTTNKPENQSEPSKTNHNLTSTDQDDEQLLAQLAIDNPKTQQPLALHYDASSSPPAAHDDPISLNYASPPPYYDEAFAPEFGDEILSPQYPPSPAPSFEAWAPEPADDYDLSPEYPSPPPYNDVMAPEFADDNYEFYSPLEAPMSPAPVSTTPASDGNIAPTPASNMVLPFTYEADDEVPEVDEQETKGEEEFGDIKKRTVVGFVIFSVCLVGLGGFVYKKRKDDHRRRSSHYQYLSKKELEL